MLQKVRKFIALDPQRKRLLVRAYFVTGSVRLGLHRRPFKHLVADLEMHRDAVQQAPQGARSLAIARSVGWAVRTAARFTPWESTCLVQVLTAQRLLQEGGVAGVFYLGASTEPGAEADSAMSAHAWLKCGDEFITGEDGHDRYTVVSSFTWA